MQNITQLKWRPVYIAYGLITLSIISLFFSRFYDEDFVKWLNSMDAADIVPGITLTKIALTILDVSMVVVVMLPLKDEDERVDKIRNFASKHTVTACLLFAIALGFYSVNFNLLIFAVFVQGYYFILFRLCLWRDSSIVYMSFDELEAYNKMILKKFRKYFIIQMCAWGFFTPLVINHYHHPEWIGISVALNAGILGLAKTVYISWKS